MNVKQHLVVFLKNSAAICAGTSVAQIIAFCSLFILTRIYGPAEFGDYSLIMAFAGFLGSVSCLSFDNAAMLTPKTSSLRNILAACMIVAFLFASVTTSMLLFYDWVFEPNMKNYETIVKYSLFSWVYIFSSGVYNAVSAIVARLNKNGAIALSKGMEPLLQYGLAIGLGLLGFGVFGLCLSSLVGLLAGILILWKAATTTIGDGSNKIKIESVLEVISENKRLPKYHFFSSLLINFNTSALILMLSIFYNDAMLGLIALALRALRTPYMITKPLGNVFTSMITNHGSVDRLRWIYITIVLKLILIAAVGILMLQFIPDSLMTWVFGDNWSGLLTPIKILAIMVSAEIIQNIVSGVYVLCQKQKLQLALVALQTLVMVMSIVTAAGLPFHDIYDLLTVISYVATIAIAVQIAVPVLFITHPKNYIKK